MGRKIIGFSFYLLLFWIVPLTAQKVYVIDSLGRTPIISVSIRTNTGYGTITNEDGIFDRGFESKYEELTLDHIGYKQLRVLTKSIGDTLVLSMLAIELDEVLLTNLSAKDIVINAIRNIDLNYPNTPYNNFGFFRQGVTENGKGVEMTEVNFIGYYNPENRRKLFNASLQKGRRSENHSKLQMETVSGVVGLIEGGDLVRKKEHFMDIEKISNYRFSYSGELSGFGDDNRSIYVIDFEPMDSTDQNYPRIGKLYIDKTDFAIQEIQYHFDQGKVKKRLDQAIRKKRFTRPEFFLKGVSATVKYNKLPDGKWYLSFIDLQNDMLGVLKEKRYNYSIFAKLIITNVEDKNVLNVKTNYNLSENFNTVVKKMTDVKDWDNKGSIQLSSREEMILQDISTY